MIDITFIGTSGSILTKDYSYPSLLINHNLLLDCGEGTTQKLMELECIDEIKTICFSHLHNDHLLGVFSLLWYYWINKRKDPLNIVGPIGIRDTIEKIIDLINTPPDMRSCELIYHELEEQDSIEPIRLDYDINYVHMEHSIPTIAYKIKKADKSLCYAGDTKPNDKLIILARNCDLLICESTFPDDLKDTAHMYNHSTPSDVISIAQKANCKRIALVHISPPFRNKIQNAKNDLTQKFSGKILIPKDLFTCSI
jgi:ribonuclease Z